MRLKGKAALVTGGARGIGRAVALACAQEGADVAITYKSSDRQAAKTVKEIESLKRKAIAIKCDVRDKRQISDAVRQALKEFGKIDILVNNAGVLVPGKLSEIKEDAWDATIDTNLKGPFLFAQATMPHMVKQRYGRIVNIASIAAFTHNSSSSVYAASKAGLLALTRIWSKELGQHNITVNAIAPGVIDTDLMRSASQEVMKKHLDNVSLGRIGKPEDVANAAVFLASDEASYITGHTLVVAGGSLLSINLP